jgi:type VI secretion system secreted protein VgrG
MPEQYTQQSSPFRFKSEDLGDDDLLITGLTGSEALSELFHFSLDLVAPLEKPVNFEDVLGKGAVVAVDVPGGEPRQFRGIVSRFAQGRRDDNFISYRLELVPPVWLLTRRVQSRIFQYLSVPEILKKVLDGFKVTYQIQGTFEPRDYCVQYRESDFAFASRLMEEEGIYYYFRHPDDGCEMVVANTPQGHAPVPDPATLVYDEDAGGNRDEPRVTTWEKVQEVRPGKVTLWDHCFELPHKHLEADQKIQEAVEVGSVTHKLSLPVADALEVYDYPGAYAQRFDGVSRGGADQSAELEKIFQDNRRTARLRIQAEAAQAVSVQGRSACPQMVAGHTFTLENHFDGDGDYVLTRVDHRASIASDAYRSGAPPEVDYQNAFACIPVALPFVPARVTPRPTVKGTQTAVVVGPPGEEIFTDKYSRIKVQFHWDREGKFDADSSCWVRVATIWAGKGWGVVHIPRIGQEVIVDFLEGDPDQPIVIGSVYNADQMPPGELPKHGMVSGLMSRTTPKGGPSNFNGFRADDSKGKEALNVQAEYDMTTLVKHDDTQTVKNNRTITVDGTHTETIKKDTAITITEGKLTHNVAANTADYHVKGKVTEFFENDLDTTVTKNVFLRSTGGTIREEAQSGEMYLFAKNQVEMKSGAANVAVIAATEIKLVTGSSSLVMKADGTITLSGVNVTVVGTAKASQGVGNQTVVCDTAKVAVAGAEINSSATGVHTVAGAVVKLN